MRRTQNKPQKIVNRLLGQEAIHRAYVAQGTTNPAKGTAMVSTTTVQSINAHVSATPGGAVGGISGLEGITRSLRR